MDIQRTEIIKILEGIAERLDEVVDIMSIDVDELNGYESEDYDAYLEDNSDQIGSTDGITENRANEITEIISREIDTIRKLAAVIEK
jgi:hypothetical protein